MCSHDEGKNHVHLEIVDHEDYEVYVCECGALINICDPKTYYEPIHPMTAAEITEMLQAVAPITAMDRLREIADRKAEIRREDEIGFGLLVREDELAMEYQRLTKNYQVIMREWIGPNWWHL